MLSDAGLWTVIFTGAGLSAVLVLLSTLCIGQFLGKDNLSYTEESVAKYTVPGLVMGTVFAVSPYFTAGTAAIAVLVALAINVGTDLLSETLVNRS